MKRHISTAVLIAVFFVGLALLLYPTVSNWWNGRVQTRAVSVYDQAVSRISQRDYTDLLESARAYNESLLGDSGRFLPDGESHELYESLLDVDGLGMMGCIEIEKLGLLLPIYHGVDADTLQNAVGHIEGSSLPVGGESTHCALSGHRGLPTAKLFTELDRLVEGDTFVLTVLGERLTYEVDQIRIVEPYDVSDLAIVAGEDYCTLVTCTPYGVNSQRMLVRGHRVENAEAAAIGEPTADADRLDNMLVAAVLGGAGLLAGLVWLLAATRRKNGRGGRGEGRHTGR